MTGTTEFSAQPILGNEAYGYNFDEFPDLQGLTTNQVLGLNDFDAKLYAVLADNPGKRTLLEIATLVDGSFELIGRANLQPHMIAVQHIAKLIPDAVSAVVNEEKGETIVAVAGYLVSPMTKQEKALGQDYLELTAQPIGKFALGGYETTVEGEAIIVHDFNEFEQEVYRCLEAAGAGRIDLFSVKKTLKEKALNTPGYDPTRHGTSEPYEGTSAEYHRLNSDLHELMTSWVELGLVEETVERYGFQAGYVEVVRGGFKPTDFVEKEDRDSRINLRRWRLPQVSE